MHRRFSLVSFTFAVLLSLSLRLAEADTPVGSYASLALDGSHPLAADLDRDGDADLVAQEVDGNGNATLVWHEQTSPAPAFSAHSIMAAPGWGIDVWTVADLDRDGDPDLVYAYSDYGTGSEVHLVWRENDGTPGDGGWSLHEIRTFDTLLGGIFRSWGLAVGDIDTDGDPDVALCHSELWGEPIGFDARVVWFESDGSPANGGFAIHVLEDWVNDQYWRELELVDLDGNGYLDLAAVQARYEGNNRDLVWYANNGSPAAGEWARHVADSTLPTDPLEIAVADLDRDGDPDLVAGGADWLAWYPNDGAPAAGEWSEEPVAAVYADGLAVVDLDLDGWPDLVEVGGLATWHENDHTPGNGGWERHDLDSEPGGSVAAVDLDSDGDPDLLSQASGVLGWYENLAIHRSAKLVDELEVDGAVNEAFDLISVDLDSDGDLDMVSASEADDRVVFHRNDGSPGNGGWVNTSVAVAVDGARSVAAGDLDGDHDVDLVSAAYNEDTVAWYASDGSPGDGGWVTRTVDNVANGVNAVALGDLDQDGHLDIVAADYLGNRITWYQNNGTVPPTFLSHALDSTPYSGPRGLAVGDIDGDGDPDVAAVSETGDAVVWYGNDGTPANGEWMRHRTDNGEADAPKDVAIADLDSDGDLDFVVAAYVGDEVLWYENDGTFAGWTARAISQSCGGARAAEVADFDLDGDPDVLLSCYDDDAIWLARGNGGSPPSFSSLLVTVSANGARAVVAADLDSDGDLDGAAAQGGDDQVAWYENRGGQFRVTAASIANDTLGGRPLEPVLRALVAHRGRSGDGDVEVASFAVRLEEGPGDPLSAWQAAALLNTVSVYGDDGDNLFERAADPLLADAAPAGIDLQGVVWVDLADGIAGAAIPAVAQGTFFVVLDLVQPLGDLAPETLRVSLMTDGAEVCEAEDRAHDVPLDLEYAANVSTPTLAVEDVLFRDGFESGDTAAWSAVQP